MKWARISVLLVVATMLVAGCSFYEYPDKMPAVDTPARDEIPEFSYTTKIQDMKIVVNDEDKGDTWNCKLVKFRIKDFPELKNKYAKAYHYAPKDQSRKYPCLILYPPTGGPNSFIKKFAAKFADEGYTVMAFQRRERFFDNKKPLEYNANLFRQTVIDVRRGIDFLETKPYADTSRVGIMGISLGGVISLLATEADPRIRSTVTVVAAGDMPEILATSGFNRIRKLRKTLTKKYDLDREKLVALAEKELSPIDPITYADRIDPQRLLMINASMDDIVKIHVALNSWEAFGKPDFLRLPTGHYSTFVFVRSLVKRADEHFLKTLRLEKGKDGRVMAKNK